MVLGSSAGGMVWRTVTVAGKVAHYGSGGSGRPVIFLHGWGLAGRTYTRALEALVAAGHRVYAPAMPGFGGTACLPDSEPRFGAYARWVEQFAEAMGISGPVTLVGHSFGGGVAARVALDHPSLVERLVLVNAVGGTAWTESKAMHQRPLWDWAWHLRAELEPGPKLVKMLPAMARDALSNALRNPMALWRAGQLARTADLTFELTVLKHRRVPVVLIWSEGDTVVPSAALQALHAAAGHAECVTVPGRHSWLIADPQRFADVISGLPPVEDDRTRAA